VKVHDRVLLANPDLGRETIYGDPVGKIVETSKMQTFGFGNSENTHWHGVRSDF
jgi:hypothetical protein